MGAIKNLLILLSITAPTAVPITTIIVTRIILCIKKFIEI